MKRKIELCMVLLLLLGMIITSKKLSELVVGKKVQEAKKVVVIDAGHGGKDPGKVGVNNSLEKDINLQIAKKVRDNLEKTGIQVVMTREEDVMGESKMADMKERVELINETQPDLTVSIHQNSYSDSSIRGAQVFYYTHSKISKDVATIVQQELKKADSENKRTIKDNDSFYMLKKTSVPTIIVECGFLSNPEEAEKLLSEKYQDEMAKSICAGILKWLKTQE